MARTVFLSSCSMELRVLIEPWGDLGIPLVLSGMQDSFIVAAWFPLDLWWGLL